MRMLLAAIIGFGLAAAPTAAQQYESQKDPVRAATADSRQRAGESKLGTKMRNTRCKIIVQKGQDKRVCGVPTNRSPSDGRNK